LKRDEGWSKASQPQLNDLLHGEIDKFSLDAMPDLVGGVGLKVPIAPRKAACDRFQCGGSVGKGRSL
jgi:hypothetical protein